jgi:hypothetical protein
MDLVSTILTALIGGGLVSLLTFFNTKKAGKKLAEAEARKVDVEGDAVLFENYGNLLERYEKRFDAQDKKIDDQNIKIEQLQALNKEQSQTIQSNVLEFQQIKPLICNNKTCIERNQNP